MKDFAAIDFETANFKRENVCSVGLVLVEEGKVVGSYYHLIQPTPNYFEERCVTVHGLTTADTNGPTHVSRRVGRDCSADTQQAIGGA